MRIQLVSYLTSSAVRIISAGTGILLFSFGFINSSVYGDTVVNNICAATDITYTFSTSSCNLFRNGNRLESEPDFCITAPGITSNKCQKKYGTMQGNVKTVATVAGSATITDCTSGSCGTVSTTCDISYLKATELKQPPEEPGSQNRIIDPMQNPIVELDCWWTGSRVEYTVMNSSNVSQTVYWPGTPFQNVTIPPINQQTLLGPVSTSVTAVESSVNVTSSGGTGWTMTATTYVGTGGASIPLLPRWAVLPLIVAFAMTGLWVLQRRKDGGFVKA